MRDLDNAYDELHRCIAKLEDVLRQPIFDRARLTTVRLEIAQLRLARGPLVGDIRAVLNPIVDDSEKRILEQMRIDHYEMLRCTAAHTAKWSLEAIAANWDEYRQASRQIARRWLEKTATNRPEATLPRTISHIFPCKLPRNRELPRGDEFAAD